MMPYIMLPSRRDERIQRLPRSLTIERFLTMNNQARIPYRVRLERILDTINRHLPIHKVPPVHGADEVLFQNLIHIPLPMYGENIPIRVYGAARRPQYDLAA